MGFAFLLFAHRDVGTFEVQVSVRVRLRFILKVAAVRKPCGGPDFPSGSGALGAQFSDFLGRFKLGLT